MRRMRAWRVEIAARKGTSLAATLDNARTCRGMNERRGNHSGHFPIVAA